MLPAAGCTHVIIGHSERRQYFAETDEMVNRKLEASLDGQLVLVQDFVRPEGKGGSSSVVVRSMEPVLLKAGQIQAIPEQRFVHQLNPEAIRCLSAIWYGAPSIPRIVVTPLAA